MPEYPDNYCIPFSIFLNQEFRIQCNSEQISSGTAYKDYTFEQLYQALSNFTLTREPGSKDEYSSFGIDLLGHIMTLKSNMSSFDELVEHNILNVLGMNDTSIGLSDSQKSRLAVGHFNGQELPTWNMSNPIAPGWCTSFNCQ